MVVKNLMRQSDSEIMNYERFLMNPSFFATSREDLVHTFISPNISF